MLSAQKKSCRFEKDFWIFEEISRQRNKSCMEEWFKAHESHFVFKDIDLGLLQDTTFSERAIDTSSSPSNGRRLLETYSSFDERGPIEFQKAAETEDREHVDGHAESAPETSIHFVMPPPTPPNKALPNRPQKRAVDDVS